MNMKDIKAEGISFDADQSDLNPVELSEFKGRDLENFRVFVDRQGHRRTERN